MFPCQAWFWSSFFLYIHIHIYCIYIHKYSLYYMCVCVYAYILKRVSILAPFGPLTELHHRQIWPRGSALRFCKCCACLERTGARRIQRCRIVLRGSPPAVTPAVCCKQGREQHFPSRPHPREEWLSVFLLSWPASDTGKVERTVSFNQLTRWFWKTVSSPKNGFFAKLASPVLGRIPSLSHLTSFLKECIFCLRLTTYNVTE